MKEKSNIKILNNLPSTPLTEAKLQSYLNGSLSSKEQYEVEQWISDEGMESDALEGLQQINIQDTQQMVYRANADLKKQLKRTRNKRTKMGLEWGWVAVVLVLILSIAAYYILHLILSK